MEEKPIKQNATNNTNGTSVDYKELVDFLSVKFEKIDQRFDEIDNKLNGKADNSKVDAVNSKVDAVLDRVIRMSDKLDDCRAEQIGMKHQLDKHEKWHFQTAAKVGIDLTSE
jgi:predicted  nucleic acid-binding Zn-ribbon protein